MGKTPLIRPPAFAVAAGLMTAGAVGGWAAPSAQADFYSLEGRYQCLEAGAATCGDAAPVAGAPAPQIAAPAGTTSGATAPPRAAASSDGPTPPVGAAPGARIPWHRTAPPADPLADIASRIKARKPAPGDLAMLEARAKAADPRALDLLAWCAYAGIGEPHDPVRAWLLYGEAAAAGAPGARRNQAALYEGTLTPEQRQRVLDIENNRAPPPASR